MNNDTFKERRRLMHELCDLWKGYFGKDWVKVMDSDSFYFPNPPQNEAELRENLINRSPNELDSMILSSRLNIEMEMK